jgi:translocation and assembly module TamB
LLSPSILLAAQPAQIDLPPGLMLDHLELTSTHAGRALKFITPILAGVTKTTGQFSVSLQGGHVPLANPLTAEVSGQLIVHSVSMQPGPILQSLLGFAQEIEGLAKGQIPFAHAQQDVSLIRIENQTVDFKLVGGRVYHRGLQFTAGNVTITTRGSVGLDETLSVVAEIPMHAGLLGNNSKLKGVNSESLQIPIEGTLQHPKIDPRTIEKLTGALLKNTTRSLLNPLQQGLEKLAPVEPKQ